MNAAHHEAAALRATAMNQFQADLLREVEKEVPDAIQLRHELHSNPYLSGEEGPVVERLAELMGVPMTSVAQTGGLGRIGPKAGPAIAIRAELDALPITEQTGVEWAARNGAMHACGHDVHQAALVALTRAARKLELPIAMLPFLQPREETYPSGARDIMESGVFRKHDVRAVLAAHVHPRVPVGSAATGRGAINAAADELTVTITGRGGHGAYPHEAIGPVTVLAHLVVGFAEILRRTISPMHPALLTVGHIRAGDAANVIPGTAHLAATLRTMDESDRIRAHNALTTFIEGQAASFGVQAEVRFVHGEPVLQNDAQLVGLIDTQLAQSGIEVAEPMRSCGADDFSYYSGEYPTVMAFVGVETRGANPPPSLHHERFLPDDESVRNVALTLASAYLGACKFVAGQALVAS